MISICITPALISMFLSWKLKGFKGEFMFSVLLTYSITTSTAPYLLSRLSELIVLSEFYSWGFRDIFNTIFLSASRRLYLPIYYDGKLSYLSWSSFLKSSCSSILTLSSYFSDKYFWWLVLDYFFGLISTPISLSYPLLVPWPLYALLPSDTLI